MKIRKAKLSDTSEILAVLKASLGEAKLQKSELIWDFKHSINPFGKSMVLVGLQDKKIIGVRAFMKWHWQLNGHIWVSYRAVDTATHPQYQGQGVFKELTLEAVEVVQQQAETFIFNTPNENSRPGYLKMGWEIVDRIKLSVVPSIWYKIKFIFSKKTLAVQSVDHNTIEALCKRHNADKELANKIFTPKSFDYLKWRYQNNPLQDYTIVSRPDCYIAMYIKKHKFFNELRVVEVLGITSKNKKEVQKIISSFASENKCWIITVADKNLFKIRLYGKFGPMLTFKALTNDISFKNKAQSITNWQYSLGDLELF